MHACGAGHSTAGRWALGLGRALPIDHERMKTRARRQGGHVSRAQLIACGFSAKQITTRVARGELERVLPGVYRLPGVRADARAGLGGGRVARRARALLRADRRLAVRSRRRRAPRRVTVATEGFGRPAPWVQVKPLRSRRPPTLNLAGLHVAPWKRCCCSAPRLCPLPG